MSLGLSLEKRARHYNRRLGFCAIGIGFCLLFTQRGKKRERRRDGWTAQEGPISTKKARGRNTKGGMGTWGHWCSRLGLVENRGFSMREREERKKIE